MIEVELTGQNGLEIFINFVKLGNSKVNGVKRSISEKENKTSKCHKN